MPVAGNVAWRLLCGDFTNMGGVNGPIATALGEVGKARVVIVDADYGANHPNAPWDKDAWASEEFAHAVEVCRVEFTCLYNYSH